MQYRSTPEADRAPEVRALEHAAGVGLLASMAIALVATLAPFRLNAPAGLRVDTELRVSDVLLNLALLAPLGFALAMRAGTSGPALSLARALSVGAALSVALEVAQLFVPMRCSSPIDVLANAASCGLGALLHARLGRRAERALLAFLRSRPSAGYVVLLASILGAVALAPLDERVVHTTFQWTLGPAAMTHGPRTMIISLIASLVLAAWLGFTLRMRALSVLAATACALPVIAAIEICRGYCRLHEASLSSLMLAVLCALVSAHAAGRMHAGRATRARAYSAGRRVWV